MDPLTGALLIGGLSAAGGMLGSKSSRWSGTKPHLEKFETLNKYQKHVLHNLLKHLNLGESEASQNPLFQEGQSYLQSILSQNPEMMKQFEAPYMRQFNEEIVPGLAERFSEMGARNSSAFQQAMGQAGAGLSERLATMRANLGMNAAQQGLGYSQVPFMQQLQRATLGLGTSPFGYQGFEGSPGMGQSILGGVGTGFGKGAGMGMAKLFGG